MTISGIIGGRGSGKTLTMVYFAKMFSKAGFKIYSNFGLAMPMTMLTKEIISDLLSNVKQGSIKLKNSIVLMDEMHNFMDSRQAMTKKNRELSYWIAQSRHTGEGTCRIFYTTQHADQVDIRLRKNTDVWIVPKITEWKKVGSRKVPVCVQVMVSEYYQHKRVRRVFRFDPGSVFDLYDTYEIIDF